MRLSRLVLPPALIPTLMNACARRRTLPHRSLPALAVLALGAACIHSPKVGEPGGQARVAPGSQSPLAVPDLNRVYQAMGLVAAGGQMPFVGALSFLSSSDADSTLMLVALSVPSKSLSFTRDGDRYAATYGVRLELRQGNVVVKQYDAREVVRVPTFKETTRTDEAVIWQQFLRLAPGQYSMSVGLKDEGNIRSSSQDVTINVPRIGRGILGSPIPFYESIPRTTTDSLPRILARPRASVVFGADSVMPVYFELTGLTAPVRVAATISVEGDQQLWTDTISVAPRDGAVSSATFNVPVNKMGIGISTLVVTRVDNSSRGTTRMLVSLGEDLPIANFDEMISYLRYFAPAEKLRVLREATPATRAQVWSEFLKSTDPLNNTPENEALRDYFQRIRVANQRFREDGPVPWQTDRGIAYVALGDPDNVYDSSMNEMQGRPRQQVWEYRAIRLQLVYYDQGGFGHWRLTSQGMADLQIAIRRKLSGIGS